MDPVVFGLLLWLLLPIVLLIIWLRSRKALKRAEDRHLEEQKKCQTKIAEKSDKLNAMAEKYAPIISIESEKDRLEQERVKLEREVSTVRQEYKEKKATFDRLKGEFAIYDEKLSFAELGIYDPHFEFGDSETYKENIKEIRARQKDMVASKRATICEAGWTVDGSISKGQAMVNRQTRLTMRAFNNECEAAIANARWNNVVAMERRILNAAKQINAANKSMKLEINDRYVSLKLEELHLTHEYRERLKVEREERAESARADREEKRLIAAAEKAEQEERKYQDLLDKARMEAGTDLTKIQELEAALAEAHATADRAKAMAEMTKSGYVYIISNIGSFGEDVVKIGLTRRLDPDDRVKELGDASVPFGFDTHAMIYSDSAPALENALHREFEDRRVNAANHRKEFFRVTLGEVEEAVGRLAPDAEFFKDREAQEWQETLMRRKAALEVLDSHEDALPDEI